MSYCFNIPFGSKFNWTVKGLSPTTAMISVEIDEDTS